MDPGIAACRLTTDDAEITASQSDPSTGVPCSNDAQVNNEDRDAISPSCFHCWLFFFKAIFTDFYHIKMMYTYWKTNRHLDKAVFDLYFRSCPFGGEFAVFAGVNESIRFINTIRFTPRQLEYLSENLPGADPKFFEYLASIDGSCLTVYAVKEGSLVFGNVPLVRVEGPLAVAQLVETPLLNLLNYPTLVATYAARHRLVAGWDKELMEFGARRAQGPDGAMSASRYSYLGTFDRTSNVRAGHIFGIPVGGTQSHSFVTSFQGLQELNTRCLSYPVNKVICEDFVSLVLTYRQKLQQLLPSKSQILMSDAELASFIAFAQAFPTQFLCLVDTYDTLSCGIPNFLAVALALNGLGLKPIGIRLDSGDLAYLSQQARNMFRKVSKEFDCPQLSEMTIVASNNINEHVLMSLNNQKHEIDSFGIGTNLVTCQAQPALGMVFKLTEINDRPTMKLSQDGEKMSCPSKKNVYRLYTKSGEPVVDLILGYKEEKPQPGIRFFCCHLYDASLRLYVIPHKVEDLLVLHWDRGVCKFKESLEESRNRCIAQLQLFRNDILRPINPTPYKVSTSLQFFQFFRSMWEQTAPVVTLE